MTIGADDWGHAHFEIPTDHGRLTQGVDRQDRCSGWGGGVRAGRGGLRFVRCVGRVGRLLGGDVRTGRSEPSRLGLPWEARAWKKERRTEAAPATSAKRHRRTAQGRRSLSRNGRNVLLRLSRAEAQVRGFARSSMSTRVAPVQIVTGYFTLGGQAEQGLSERRRGIGG